MRIKSVKRNFSNVLKKAKNILKERLDDLNIQVNVLSRIKYEIERELDEIKYYGFKPPSEQFIEDLNLKYKVVTNNIINKLKEINKVKTHFKIFQKTVNNLMNQSIQ